MSDKTSIQWTDATWNPISGCSKVSPGCKNCYAEHDWARLSKNPKSPYFEREFTDVRCHPERLDQPLQWRAPRRIFVNSMSDLFHEDVPWDFIDEAFARMAACQEHSFQILTKRPQAMGRYILGDPVNRIDAIINRMAGDRGWCMDECHIWPLSNVWLGVSVENQETADERIPILLQTSAAVRFLSVEPLLEQVDLRLLASKPRPDWVIVGGESGPNARPCNLQWIRSIVNYCRAAQVACFVKQLGSHPRFDRDETRRVLRHRKGGDPAEWPEDLRVREFPR